MSPTAPHPGSRVEAPVPGPRSGVHTRATPAALRLLLQRHSLGPRFMAAPGPTAAQLRTAVQAALRAPDHGRLLPWRAVVVPDARRAELGDLFAQVARDTGRTDEDVAIERERAHKGPALVAWVVHIHDALDEVPVHEQWMSAGGALTNFLNALHLMGYAAKTLSGRKCRHPLLTRAFCGTGEALVAFVCIGTPLKRPQARVTDDVDEMLSTWDGVSGRVAPPV